MDDGLTPAVVVRGPRGKSIRLAPGSGLQVGDTVRVGDQPDPRWWPRLLAWLRRRPPPVRDEFWTVCQDDAS